MHTPWRTARWPLPWSFSTFDYRELCALLWDRCGDAEFETATVTGRLGDTVLTDRGELTAPHRLMSSGEIADLVEVVDINWNRNIGGVAVVKEMLKADLDRNGADEFAEARHLEIFHMPDL